MHGPRISIVSGLVDADDEADETGYAVLGPSHAIESRGSSPWSPILRKYMGVLRSFTFALERGASNATADTLARLADALGAEIRILRDEDRALARLPEFARSRAKADAEIANGRSIEAGAFFCAETPPPGLKHSATRGRSSKTRRA